MQVVPTLEDMGNIVGPVDLNERKGHCIDYKKATDCNEENGFWAAPILRRLGASLDDVSHKLNLSKIDISSGCVIVKWLQGTSWLPWKLLAVTTGKSLSEGSRCPTATERCEQIGAPFKRVVDNYMGKKLNGLGQPEPASSRVNLAEWGGACCFPSIFYLLIGRESGEYAKVHHKQTQSHWNSMSESFRFVALPKPRRKSGSQIRTECH